MYSIHTDVPVTRRIRMHHILDDQEILVFSAATIDECVFWLIDQGQTKCLIRGPAIDQKYTVTMDFGC